MSTEGRTASIRRRWKPVVALAVFVAAGLQFVPVARTNPPVTSELSAAPAVHDLLRRACYDCHSHETRWPWYSRVAPVSWLVAHHVEDGRGQLNFSAWPTFDFDQQDHLLREIAEELSSGEMPPRSYLLGHGEARLSEAEVQRLVAWAREG